MRLWGGEPYDIDTDALYLSYSVRNTGRAAASPTRAVLLTTTDLFAEDPSFQSLAVRPVPALEPGDSLFFDAIRVPFDELVPGSNNYFALVVLPVDEEDPDLVDNNRGGARDYTTIFLSDGGRIQTTCTGFERDVRAWYPGPTAGTTVGAS